MIDSTVYKRAAREDRSGKRQEGFDF